MRETLLDRAVMAATEAPAVAMLPYCHVVKVGGRSILDGGRGRHTRWLRPSAAR